MCRRQPSLSHPPRSHAAEAARGAEALLALHPHPLDAVQDPTFPELCAPAAEQLAAAAASAQAAAARQR